ncbi:MAG: Nudix family hydrolase [Candidatus Thiodiazotropha sp.]|jgi:8-oxo-dGTP diphosphatase
MTIHVAAGAIIKSDGRVLLSKRAKHAHQGGMWEFPGGKLEPGESPVQALARELKEELDIQPKHCEPLIRIRHDYGDRKLLLDFYRITDFAGEVTGMEGQPLRWLWPEDMLPEEFPAADRPVITALKLPRRYMITGDDPTQTSQFLNRLEWALEKGISLVQLRAHQLPDAVYRDLLHQVQQRCFSTGAKVVINRPERILDWIGEADGIHLTSRGLISQVRRPLGEGMIGASCHSMAELKHAERLGLDYALLSPVQMTASHPQATCLGWERFANWVERVNLPVYALGGVEDSDLSNASMSGAQGIAGISTYWRSVSKSIIGN